MAASAHTDWDFRGADTRRFTHGIHPYPAMLIPQISERLIDRYGKKGKMLFDPYCGTGSSLLEANIRGMDAVGTDLNPLARLIAKAKTKRLSCQKVSLYIRDINARLLQARMDAPASDPPPMKNLLFWFSEKVARDLTAARDIVSDVDDKDVRRFLQVAFAETARECSYTRNGEFKMYRMKAEHMEKFSPDVFGVFMGKVARNFSGLQAYAKEVKKPGVSRVFDFNTIEGVPEKILPSESADIVVTSPPYCDSRTTVAYGQFSRFANEWLGQENASSVDRALMGGQPKKNGSESLGCDKLDDAVGKIAESHPVRAREISSFYEDYRQSIAHVAGAVKPGKHACYVVGNRKSKGVVLPTDEATVAYFAENGFKKAAVFVRNIPNKRMPSRNSPSNVVGAQDETMLREHIIVMQKKR